jgi:ABC-type amino acid transport system permease subunit
MIPWWAWILIVVVGIPLLLIILLIIFFVLAALGAKEEAKLYDMYDDYPHDMNRYL